MIRADVYGVLKERERQFYERLHAEKSRLEDSLNQNRKKITNVKNITEITNYYIEKFKSDIYKDLNTRVILNGKKAKKGNASINIYISANGKEYSSLS